MYKLLWKPSPRLQKVASVYDKFFSTLPDNLRKGLLNVSDKVDTKVFMPLLHSKPEWLSDVFSRALVDYQKYLASVSVPWQIYLASENKWEILRKFQSELFHPLCAVVEENELLGRAEVKETLSGIAVLFDHDNWILNLISKNTHAQERLIAIPEFLEMEGYYVNAGLCFTAILTIIMRDMKEEQVIRNGKTLVHWFGSYTNELEDYLDTLTILMDPSKMKDIEVSEEEIRSGRAEPMEIDFPEV